MAGDALDGVAVAVARGVVGARVHAVGVAAEQRLDAAHALEELGPVVRAERAHAGDAVGDGELVLCAAEVLPSAEVFDGGAEVLRALGDEVGHGARVDVVLPDRVPQVDDEGFGDLALRERAQGLGDARGVCGDGGCDASRAGVGGVFGGERRDAGDDHQEPEAQHDGHGPQLADGERAHRLVALDVEDERAGLDARVGVTEVVDAEGVHARVLAQRAVAHARELAEVAAREVDLDLAELVFDDVCVVEEPLLGGGRVSYGAHLAGEVVVRAADLRLRLGEAREEHRGSPAARWGAVKICEALGALGEARAAEHLPAERGDVAEPRVDFEWAPRRVAAHDPRPVSA